jgi:hypothetical protein
MAQTKKRRRRKHRGTQAGTLGKRRSRPRSRAEAKAQARSRASSSKKSSRNQRVADRIGSPPTWRGAVNRALIASGVFLLLLVLLFRRPFLEAFGLSAFMLLVYIPMGYYMDRFFYRMKLRREQKKRLEQQAEKEKAKA